MNGFFAAKVRASAVLLLFCVAANHASSAADAGKPAPAKKSVPINVLPLDAAEAAKVSFARQIKPLLVDNCIECHSAEDRKGDFEVTSVANLLKHGKKAGPGVVPGKPDESAIVEYIRGQREPQMPKGNPVLSEAELHLIRSWIFAGAKDDTAALSAAELAALKDKEKAHAQKKPVSKEVEGALLQAENNEQLLIARRALRLSQMKPAAAPPTVKAPVFNPIDAFVAAYWEKDGLLEASQPPPVCDDVAFLRRVYLDVVGAIPTVAESQRFLRSPAPDKRARVVDDLLARNGDYADHWSPFWEEALGSANVNSQGGIVTRGNYRAWINDSFLKNKPYDVMVAELLDPTMPGHPKNGEQEILGQKFPVGFVRNTTHTATIQTAAEVGQVFLATAMKCASCHSHFENKEWPQARFLAFAGMFAPHDLELIRCEKKSGQFIAARFPFEIADAPLDAPENPEARLHRVAQLITDPANPRFAKAIVNRLWKRYLGLGLFEPVDDFRADRTPTNPELLEWLADDFMRHGYDLKHTIRLILTSRTYQLKYNPALEDHYDVARPTVARYFRSPSLRRLTAEELLDSFEVMSHQNLDPAKRLFRNENSTELSLVLGRPSVRNEISTARSEEPATVQSLELLNGSEYHDDIYNAKILDLLAPEKNLAVMADALYLAALGRSPTTEESALAVNFLKSEQANLASGQAQPVEKVMVDEKQPFMTMAEGSAGTNSWKWVSAPQFPVFSGTRAFTYGGTNRLRQLALDFKKRPVRVRSQDIFYTYVYLDPKDPPKRLMLQWRQREILYQALWTDETDPQLPPTEKTYRFLMGGLPPRGEWVRLNVPFKNIKMDDGYLIGWAYDQSGGTVYWDKTGIIQVPRDPMTVPMGDMLWALVTAPEFQYIR